MSDNDAMMLFGFVVFCLVALVTTWCIRSNR